MHVGYARTSTVDQVAGFEAQLDELKKARCEKIFSEQISSVGKRTQLEAALEFCREGDVFIVTKLDRLARSMIHLVGDHRFTGEKEGRIEDSKPESRQRDANRTLDAQSLGIGGAVRARDYGGAPARGNREGKA
ncbi:MAG TPA: recombinase family protein [Rhizomicrobium sp.]|nr:recombinase family protein [Rhizomicrobium sp.]